MTEDKIEEETYSLIFTSLKHPLRRKILRMLSDKPLSFSEILEQLTIDSGHLNYHLENLGDIITHTKDGKYELSSVGSAAVKLMNKVEEQDASAKTNKRERKISKTTLVFSVIFAVALLAATVYAMTYTTQTSSGLFEANQETERILVSIQPNQIFSYAFTLNAQDFDSGHSYSIGQNETAATISPVDNSITPQWARYFSYTTLRLNGTYDISINIYDPYGTLVSHRQESGNISSLQNIPIDFEFTTLGTFTLQMANLGLGEFSATLIPQGTYIIYNKPLFNYGAVGLTLLLIYTVLLSWILIRKPRQHNYS